MAKQARSKREKSTTKTKPSVKSVERVGMTLQAKSKHPDPTTNGVAPETKKVSEKFLQAMQKRKAQGGWGQPQGANGVKVGRRRGRRPKAAAEYTPENSSEETYALESDLERIEYDTGISYRPQGGGDDSGFSLERFDDFDEELNFDR